MTDLLPCPFCGGKPQFTEDYFFLCCVECKDCFATTQWRRVKQEVIDLWNMRVSHDGKIELTKDEKYVKFLRGVHSSSNDEIE